MKLTESLLNYPIENVYTQMHGLFSNFQKSLIEKIHPYELHWQVGYLDLATAVWSGKVRNKLTAVAKSK